ncbi:Transcription repressor OFP12, partial [Cucurbita argyrosperma subsp. argyrosperma]
MPTKLGRSYLNLCFTKIKNPLATHSSPITHAPDPHRPTRPLPSSSAAATFITNYNSLYEIATLDSNPFFVATNDGGDSDTHVAVDFITAFTSHRFFFSSPGRSNSIIESSTTTAAAAATATATKSTNSLSSDDLLLNNSLAIPTYSPDPYIDFRRSMEEMVEAREEMEVVKSSWEFLHELLLCYLALNPKTTHKHILKAFADLAKVTKPPLPPPAAAEEDGSRGREAESAEISDQQNDGD